MAKYCTNCGKEVEKNDVFCQYCGKQLVEEKELVKEGETVVDPTRTNPLALAGFIVSLGSFFISFWGITAIVGIILSSVGLSKIGKTNENGKGFAIAGIIIGASSILVTLLAFIFLFFLALWA